jgi:lipopolysaccharide biosynthesis protein
MSVLFLVPKPIHILPIPEMVRGSVEGGVPGQTLPRLCFFSHHDSDGRIDDHVLHHVRALRSIDAEVIFLTSCDRLQEGEITRLNPYCSRVLFRKNEGRDFGAWRVGLSLAGDLRHYDEIILTNDSVYGPLFPLQESFSRMGSSDCALWGITDSWAGLGQTWNDYHVQSYFLVLTRPLIQSELFASFWRDHDFSLARNEIIHCYEIGFTRRAEEAGFRVGAACDFCYLRDLILTHLPSHPYHGAIRDFMHNPTHYYWKELLLLCRCPFLKVDLLRDNGEGIPNVHEWYRVLRSASDYDPELILRHQRRLTRRVSGPYPNT